MLLSATQHLLQVSIETMRKLAALIPLGQSIFSLFDERSGEEIMLPISIFFFFLRGRRYVLRHSFTSVLLSSRSQLLHCLCYTPMPLSETLDFQVRNRMVHPEPQHSRSCLRGKERKFEKGHKGTIVFHLYLSHKHSQIYRITFFFFFKVIWEAPEPKLIKTMVMTDLFSYK